MKTYEKYLITEATTLTKKLKSLKKKILDVSSETEYRVAMKSVIDFLKRYRDKFDDELSSELHDMLVVAQKRTK